MYCIITTPLFRNQVTLYILLFGSKLNIKKNVEHFSETCYFESKERKIYKKKSNQQYGDVLRVCYIHTYVTNNDGIWGGCFLIHLKENEILIRSQNSLFNNNLKAYYGGYTNRPLQLMFAIFKKKPINLHF